MDLLSSPNAIGKRIKDLREKSSETQNDLAKSIGCTQNTISKLENGKSLTSENLISISKHYNVSMDYLCTGKCSNTLVDILSHFISLSLTKYESLIDNDSYYCVPELKIRKPLYVFISQIANANNDENIPEELRAKWIDFEIERFNSSMQAEPNDDYATFIPISKNTASNNPEILKIASKH